MRTKQHLYRHAILSNHLRVNLRRRGAICCWYIKYTPVTDLYRADDELIQNTPSIPHIQKKYRRRDYIHVSKTSMAILRIKRNCIEFHFQCYREFALINQFALCPLYENTYQEHRISNICTSSKCYITFCETLCADHNILDSGFFCTSQ